MLTLSWMKCTGDNWCPFDDLDLSKIVEELGIYVIWHGGDKPWTVRVGQGDIADRIQKHRKDTEITYYRSKGRLYVTWVAVPAAQLDGVERYLGDTLRPLVGDAFPDVQPIAVNSPFG